MQIEYLADHLDIAPVLAEWHHTEWAGLLPWWTAEAARTELLTHRLRRAIPTTLIAMEGSRLIGSVSLVQEDLPEWRHLTPWLSSLYVVPRDRGKGIGRRLVSACLAEAAALGVHRLYLFTSGQSLYYERQGWGLVEQITYYGEQAAVLDRATEG
jgi:predicted N-acetyltransferase YhbS